MDNNYNGIGFWGALQLALIILKLCKILTWSWLAVFTPTLISIGILGVVIIAYFIAVRRKK